MYENLERIKQLIDDSGRKYDMEKIQRAYLYAKQLHEGQFRASGEPYIMHPVSVAEIAASLGLDTDSICAALLHDTVEDCGTLVSLDDISEKFGPEVANLVDGLTKLVSIPFNDKAEEQMENLRKMFLAMNKDIRVIFVKLCDRLHNMRTLAAKKEEKRRITALETMHVYAPLAHRLGMQRMKQELENLSISYLDPVGYAEVKADIDRKFGEHRDFIQKIKEQLADKLSENGYEFQIFGRVKSVYSIYRKMFDQNKSFDEIYDFYAVRIITNTELECYTALGIIHDAYKSIPGRFKDYISTPKPNMYQSLHTTVIGHEGFPFEVQIRTWDMHRIAEYGVAAHWKYKDKVKGTDSEDKAYAWISRLIESEDTAMDPDEFMRSLKVDIYQNEVFVFTPKGDVITLPKGATLIDFAYAIHSQVGNRMVGAKVNGIICPIDKSPKNGDLVEILTSSASKGPSRDWLNLVKTGEARNKIRQWFKKEKKAENILVGRAELEKEFKRYGKFCTPAQKDEIIENLAIRIGMQSGEDLCNTIGFGGMTAMKLTNRIREEIDKVVVVNEPTLVPDLDKIVTKPHKKNNSGVIIDGVDGLEVKFAKCCNPLPGDKIVGFVTRGYGITVHKRDCQNVVAGLERPDGSDRYLPAYWEQAVLQPAGSANLFESSLIVTAENDMLVLASITTALADMKVSTHQINMQSKGDTVLVTLTIGAKNTSHVSSIESRLRSLDHVINVTRGKL